MRSGRTASRKGEGKEEEEEVVVVTAMATLAKMKVVLSMGSMGGIARETVSGEA